MPQKCKICAHPETKAMEEKYVNNVPKTSIAKKFGVPNQSVDYHMDNHLPEKLVRSVQQKEQSHAEDILSGINELLNRTKTILSQAEEQGHKRLALDAIKEARGTYELLSKIAVKLEDYRRADRDKEKGDLEQQASEGLKALTDAELWAFIQLMGKVHENDPEYELDAKSRYIVDAMQMGQSDFPRMREREVRNSSKDGLDVLLNENEIEDDFWEDDLDLDFDDLSADQTIPSDEDDPSWMKAERKSNRY